LGPRSLSTAAEGFRLVGRLRVHLLRPRCAHLRQAPRRHHRGTDSLFPPVRAGARRATSQASNGRRHGRRRRRRAAAPRAGLPMTTNGSSACLLEATAVTKRFSGITALDGVTLEVARGEAVGLIGPNGAGKTTFFNCVLGMLTPEAGRVLFDRRDITRLA